MDDDFWFEPDLDSSRSQRIDSILSTSWYKIIDWLMLSFIFHSETVLNFVVWHAVGLLLFLILLVVLFACTLT